MTGTYLCPLRRAQLPTLARCFPGAAGVWQRLRAEWLAPVRASCFPTPREALNPTPHRWLAGEGGRVRSGCGSLHPEDFHQHCLVARERGTPTRIHRSDQDGQLLVVTVDAEGAVIERYFFIAHLPEQGSDAYEAMAAAFTAALAVSAGKWRRFLRNFEFPQADRAGAAMDRRARRGRDPLSEIRKGRWCGEEPSANERCGHRALAHRTGRGFRLALQKSLRAKWHTVMSHKLSVHQQSRAATT